MDIAIREQRVLFAQKLEHHMWSDYMAGRRIEFEGGMPVDVTDDYRNTTW